MKPRLEVVTLVHLEPEKEGDRSTGSLSTEKDLRYLYRDESTITTQGETIHRNDHRGTDRGTPEVYRGYRDQMGRDRD